MDINKLYDLIIIGGGPAGITAGIYATRQKMNFLLITKNFGGQLARKTVPVENWPGNLKISGEQLIRNFEKHLRKYTIDIERDEVSKIKKITDASKNNNYFLITTKSKNKFKAISVIIATGADPRPLEIPGEKEFLGKGVSYCPLCDGPIFSKKIVAVIGGGNSAMEAVLFLAKYVKKIYILEFGAKLSAFEDLQEKAKKTGKVEVITNASVKKIEGKNVVERLIYEETNIKKENILKVNGVFVEIGNHPATSFVKDLVEFSNRDEIKINPYTCETKTPGLFAAGDVTDVFPKQIVVAAGEGAKAAVNAYKYIQGIKN